MIIPVRCFTCGKVLANKWNAYEKRVQELDAEQEKDAEAKADDTHELFKSKLKGKILHELGITKMCCKRHMLTHIDIIDYL
jgi:DNA-directed RNA polymerase subunit N (RpoN/RPB10)